LQQKPLEDHKGLREVFFYPFSACGDEDQRGDRSIRTLKVFFRKGAGAEDRTRIVMIKAEWCMLSNERSMGGGSTRQFIKKANKTALFFVMLLT
jgi:hypothetical protein